MATREAKAQAEHDEALQAAAEFYRQLDRQVWTNPGAEKNRRWNGQYIDLIIASNAEGTRAWLVELETTDSVCDAEARGQWHDHDAAYHHWYLVVPAGCETRARRLLHKHGIRNCDGVATWARNSLGIHTFWDLPGV